MLTDHSVDCQARQVQDCQQCEEYPEAALEPQHVWAPRGWDCNIIRVVDDWFTMGEFGQVN